MINVIVFGITHNPGGMESVIMNYYRNMDMRKIHFDFFGKEDLKMCFEKELVKNGSSVYYFPRRGMNPFRFHKFKQAIKSIFSQKKYDVLWFNECVLSNIDYIKIAKKCGIKKRIIHAHNNKIMEKKSIKKIILLFFHNFHKLIINRYATDFWSCSNETSKFFYTKKIRRSKRHRIINNAIDCNKVKFSNYLRNKYRKLLKVKNSLVLGNVGRLNFQKNQSFAIKVLSKLRNKGFNAVLLLIGQGEDEKKLKTFSIALKVDRYVRFLGARKDIYGILNCMDVFLFPSVFEGFGIASIEAQANGMKVYNSTFVPKTTKIIANTKYLPLNVDKWVDEIIDDTRINNNRKECYKSLILNNFSIKNESRKLEQIFLK